MEERSINSTTPILPQPGVEVLICNSPTKGAKAEASLGYVKKVSQQSNKKAFRPGFPLGKNGE